jgi:hypothetical protein
MLKNLNPLNMFRKILFILFVGSVQILNAQDIIFFGNGIEVTTSENNIPEPGDNTYFGSVDVGTTKTLTFTVTNVYDGFWSFLGLNISTPQVSGINASDFSVSNPMNSNILFGESTTFTVTFNPNTIGIKDAVITVTPTLLIFPISANSFNVRGVGESPLITAYEKGGNTITNNSASLVSNGTDFREITVGQANTNNFVIKNEGTKPLTIDYNAAGSSVTESIAGEFSYANIPTLPATILPGEFVEFSVKYAPQDTTTDNLKLSLTTNDSNNNPFVINFTGKGTNAAASSEIMITQYYEVNGNTNNNNDKIEIKNISNQTIPSGRYFLAVFGNRSFNQSPSFYLSIASLSAGQVRVYQRSDFSRNGNSGSALLDGTEAVVISTVGNSNQCYANRVDIIGERPNNWGANKSFTKSYCASETAQINYYERDWLELTTNEVNLASNQQNISLGTYNLGSISWNGSAWSNSSLPDKSRQVIINGNYTASNGGFVACELVVNSNLNFNSNTTNSVVVYGDLIINGNFTIGDRESLVMYNDNAYISGNITKIEKSAPLNNRYDNTYWSSPINNGVISSVFSGVAPARIFKMEPTAVNPVYAGTDFEHWFVATGTMVKGKGYAAESTGSVTYPGGQHQISFTGKPNNGVINAQIVKNKKTEINDWNLVGNPYPSALNANTFITTNAGKFAGTIYLWKHAIPLTNGQFDQNDYVLYNLSGGSSPGVTNNIGSSQGFMIRATQTSTITFNNAMRMVNANTQFYKNDIKKGEEEVLAEKDKIWLQLKDSKDASKGILLAFFEEATDAIDFGYDGETMDGDLALNFYSKMENKKYGIQAFGKFNPDKKLSLGFDIESPEKLIISIQEVEGKLKNENIYLVDNTIGIVHDLNQEDYVFEQTEAGIFDNRFTLQFENAVLDVETNQLNNDFIISSQDNALKINSGLTVKAINVYDMMGRLLYQNKPNMQSFYIETTNINRGSILLVNATLENGTVIRKKTMRY